MPIISGGAINSYNISDNKRDVSMEFYAFKSPKSPFWNEINVGEPVFGTKHFWWIDKPLPTKTTVKTGHNYTSGDYTLYLTSGAGVVIGTILRVNDIMYRVSNITYGTNDIAELVLLSTADANHTAGDTVEFLNNAQKENAAPPASDYINKQECWNVTQIYQEHFSISGTQKEVSRETPDTLFNNELRLRRDRIYNVIGNALWNSPRIEGNETTPRVMGGVYDLISQTNYGYKATATTFSETNFNTFLDKMTYEYGADIKNGGAQIWMTGNDYNKFLALNATSIRVDQSNTTVGRIVNRYVSKKYDVELRVDDYCRENYITLINPNQVYFRPLNNRQLKWELMPSNTDGDDYKLIMEATIEIRNIGTCGIFEIS